LVHDTILQEQLKGTPGLECACPHNPSYRGVVTAGRSGQRGRPCGRPAPGGRSRVGSHQGSPPCRAETNPAPPNRLRLLAGPAASNADAVAEQRGSRNQRGDPLRGPTFACAATPPPRQKGGPSGSPVAPLADTRPGRREGRTSASSLSRRTARRPPQSPCREMTGSPP